MEMYIAGHNYVTTWTILGSDLKWRESPIVVFVFYMNSEGWSHHFILNT